MKKILMIVAAVALVSALGCQKHSTTASNPSGSTEASVGQQTNLSPEDLGELGARIKKNPQDAEKLLSEKGLTEQQFEQAVRKVAESPDQSKRYTAAYKKAS
jgi:hypothetical protein